MRQYCTLKDFANIAQIILNRLELVVKSTHVFRICEIEFYYFSEQHPDRYVHCSRSQLQSQMFYFHQYPNGTYKNGTYKGMDITLGHEERNVYVGVLIRTIMDRATGAVIEGPCRSVNRILELNGVKEVKELLPQRELIPCFRENDKLYLRECDSSSEAIWVGPRIGLSDKYPQFRDVHYRCVVLPKKIKKQRGLLREGVPVCWGIAAVGEAPPGEGVKPE